MLLQRPYFYCHGQPVTLDLPPQLGKFISSLAEPLELDQNRPSSALLFSDL